MSKSIKHQREPVIQSYYDMPITKTWLGYYIKSKDFDKARCPICKKYMTYKSNCAVIEFACENTKCKGYFRWLNAIPKTLNGDIDLNDR